MIATNFNQTTLASPSAGHIADAIAERITVGVYKSGHWLPSERSLADEFRVSRIIIRAAIKELEKRKLVTCSARCRPLVRFSPQGGDISRRGSKRRSLALWIWPSPTWPGAMMIISGIRQNLDEDGFRLVFESAIGETPEALLRSEERFLRRIGDDHDIEGVALWYLGADQNLPALQALRAAGIPMVFLDRLPPPGFNSDYVGVDNVRAAEQVVTHLIELGHRRIAHITNLDTASTTGERLQGYRRALDRWDIPFDGTLVWQDIDDSQDRPDPCMTLVRELMAVPNPPTAIFAVNDIVARRVIASLRAAGIRVPEDISIAGFDGVHRRTPGAAFLTTVRQPFDSIGAVAVDLLLARIDAGNTGAYKHVVLDAPLHIGGSTSARDRTGGLQDITDSRSEKETVYETA